MPAIHSNFNQAEGVEAIGMKLLPIKSKVKGTAPPAADDKEDIVDEVVFFVFFFRFFCCTFYLLIIFFFKALQLFRANVLFASFDINGPGDRLLVYLTLYIQQCLVRIEAKGATKGKKDAEKVMIELARESFPMPGEAGWALGGHIPAAKGRAEADQARSYLKHIREELGLRLLDCIFYEDGKINKFWMSYSKKKFMGIPVS